MNPKDIARMITEDPDVINEGHCTACGGWDKKQGGKGHELGCPVGKAGTPIGVANIPVATIPSGWEEVEEDMYNYPYEGGYSATEGGKVLRFKFHAQRSGVIFGSAFEPGDNFIQIESRYGYVDAWLNDKWSIVDKDEFANPPSRSSWKMYPNYKADRDQAIARVSDKVNDELRRIGII